MKTSTENVKLFELDHQLRTAYNVKLADCKYFIGDKYIKIFWNDYVYIYNIKNNHVQEVHDLRYSYLDCFNNFKRVKGWGLSK